VVWSDGEEWERRRQPDGCVICRSGGPLDVIAETSACWISAPAEAPLPGYLCVTSKTHVNEPFELPADQQNAFWQDSMTVARALAAALTPIKMNYEIHGNTLPHLHLHLFPRAVDDPYVGGPIDPGRGSVHRTEEDVAALRDAVRKALRP
jgi:diadenosine tetraphosphate (Ap4A) HIT family hydrolase